MTSSAAVVRSLRLPIGQSIPAPSTVIFHNRLRQSNEIHIILLPPEEADPFMALRSSRRVPSVALREEFDFTVLLPEGEPLERFHGAHGKVIQLKRK